MAIVSKKERPIEIDLTGPEGNAFVLFGYARKFARQLDCDPEPILADMKSGDYEHLVRVFDREFGSFVTLIR
jgi:hypothetical protein